MMSALSVAFLQLVYRNCCCGWNAWFCKAVFHPDMFGVVQSP